MPIDWVTELKKEEFSALVQFRTGPVWNCMPLLVASDLSTVVSSTSGTSTLVVVVLLTTVDKSLEND